ncbi:alpha/beta fold hydrolase, partial [Candidatus Peregrinibacteria bacterium]|nr:alpha/beta fold hydrolase [Candidatus Peregrinibacteria bacterium]
TCLGTVFQGDGSQTAINVKGNYALLSGCSVEGFYYGMEVTGSNSTITQNDLRNNRYGFYIFPYNGKASENKITHNTLVNNTQAGISVDDYYGVDPQKNFFFANTLRDNGYGFMLEDGIQNNIVANAIVNNSNTGLYMGSSSASTNVTENRITQNKRDGIYDYSSFNVYKYNTITSNSRYNFYNDLPSERDALYNDWGVYTPAEIDATIFDDDEDYRKGKVLFDPWIGEQEQYPVVLVHGYCSEPEAWEDSGFKEKLENEGYDVYLADYEPGVCFPFIPGTPGCANKDIKTYGKRLSKFVNQVKKDTGAKKVNLIASSMGGLVSRSYIESSVYAQDVNQLIMIGTPNHGSTLADVSVITNLALALWGPSFDPTIIHCMGQVGEATVQLSELSSFLSDLNYNDPFFSYDRWMGKESLEETVGYKTLAGWNYSTLVLLKDPVFGVLNIPKPSITRNGDLVVPAYSLKLDGVGCYQTEERHLGEMGNEMIFENVIDFLEKPYLPQGDNCLSEERILLDEEQLYTEKSPKIEGVLAQYQQQNVTVFVDATSFNLTFTTLWNDITTNLSVTITDPYGVIVDAAYPNTTIVQGFGLSIVRVSGEAIPGNWTVQLFNQNSEDRTYSFQALYTTSLHFELMPTNASTTLQLYQPLSVLSYLALGEGKILPETISMRVTQPNGSVQQMPLYDDGLHGDLNASDGYFGNIFSETSHYGIYKVDARVETSYQNETVAREETFYFSVETITDIGLENLNVSLNGTNEGDLVTIFFSAINLGNQTAYNVTLFVYDNPPQVGGEEIATITFNQLNPREKKSRLVMWNATQGTKNITVLLSPFDDYIDTNESNNLLIAPPQYFNGKPIIEEEQELVVIKAFGYNITASAYDPENDSLSCTLLHKPSNKVSFELLSGFVDVNGTCWTTLTTNTTYNGRLYRAGENVTTSIRFTDIHNA